MADFVAAGRGSGAVMRGHPSEKDGSEGVNYPDLPRLGLPGPRLLRSGLPGSVSELAPDVGTAVPDSAGGFPLGGSECPAPPGSTFCHNRRRTLLVAFERRWKRGGHLAIIFDRRSSKRGGKRIFEPCERCIPSLLCSPRSLRGGRGLAPSPQKLDTHIVAPRATILSDTSDATAPVTVSGSSRCMSPNVDEQVHVLVSDSIAFVFSSLLKGRNNTGLMTLRVRYKEHRHADP